MSIPDPDPWLEAFLADEPRYTKPTWIAAYAEAWARRRPEQTPEQVMQAAREAFVREGSWNNPKIAAGCDAAFGPRPNHGELSYVASEHAETERRHIAQLAQRIADGKHRVAKLHSLVAAAAEFGQDTTLADKLLEQMRRSVALLCQLREIASSLLTQMERTDGAAARQSVGRPASRPDRTEWVAAFSDELCRLRPHTSVAAAWAIGLDTYRDGDGDPAVAARECHNAASEPTPARSEQR